ncbi:MAG: hypothetical protein FalmKO_30340 [Falsiruegeria mediterranea]
MPGAICKRALLGRTSAFGQALFAGLAPFAIAAVDGLDWNAAAPLGAFEAGAAFRVCFRALIPARFRAPATRQAPRGRIGARNLQAFLIGGSAAVSACGASGARWADLAVAALA